MDGVAQSGPDPALYRQIEDLPEHLTGEILDGRLVTHPRPAWPHAIAAGALHSQVQRAYHLGRGGPGGWVVVFEPELHLEADVLAPDIGGWRRERLGGKVPKIAAATIAPDWVCEVTSPSAGPRDRVVKSRLYHRHGVAYYWIIDPDTRTLEVFERRPDGWLLAQTASDDDTVSPAPFPELALSLADLWLV